MPRDNFVDPDKISVIIPYSTLVDVVNMAQELKEIRKQNKRIEDQYTAIRGMFSECLQKIADLEDWVKD